MPLDWIDGHLDLAYLALRGRDLRSAAVPAGGCVTLPALRRASVAVAFGTIYTAPGETGPEGYAGPDDRDAAADAGARQLRVYEELAAAGEIALVRTVADLDAPGPRPKIVLLMEGADPIRGAADVPRWHDAGLRLAGLTWAAGTRYAGGNGGGGGLTAEGIELVRALDDAGIVHDASHLSDAAFDDLMEHARGRVVATHSNARALVAPDERHLRDEQIRAIAERGGVVGLNLYAPFLARGRRATLRDAVAHVEHVAEVMGHRNGVALGSDMDGGFGPDDLPAGLPCAEALPVLAAALRHAGWTAPDIAAFAHGNWRRFLVEALA